MSVHHFLRFIILSRNVYVAIHSLKRSLHSSHILAERDFTLFVVQHKRLDTFDGHQCFGQLTDSLWKEYGHRLTQNIVVGCDDECLLGGNKISQQCKSDQTDEDRDTRSEHYKGQQNTAHVRYVSDDFDFFAVNK